MATALAQVKVTRVEAGNGFLITCTCGDRAVRGSRPTADTYAAGHRASHGPEARR